MKILIILTLFSISLQLQAQVKHVGSMSEMGKNGFRASVKLDSLLQRDHLYGLGPYGKMRGEITTIDGVPYVAFADENGQLKVETDEQAEAPFFVYTHVNAWQTFEMSLDIDNANDLQQVIQQLARQNGYNLAEPFPVRIMTQIDELTIKVVSPRSPEIPGYKEGVSEYSFSFNAISGEIFGFYSESAQGIYTGKDSNLHLHFISEDRSKMGHIKDFSISSKQVKIMLPFNPTLGSGIQLKTIDTDFSKGRLNYVQQIGLDDLEKFHGHLCDGLVVGALAMEQAVKVLYPEQPIDRTNLRIVSQPSPCLTDVAIYLTGGRYQFNTFYVASDFEGLYIIQRTDNLQTVSVALNQGVKPAEIDSLGNIAIKQELAPCDIDYLRKLEEQFTETLLRSEAEDLFTVTDITDFQWQPNAKNDYIKIDILNKDLPECR
ncbi:MAG: acetolactate decarboxylase [Cyclobacteriaceae bacterium]